MIFDATGEISHRLHMLGHSAAPVYLLDSGVHAAVFDAGFSFMGARYVEELKTVLKGREPSFLLLTHSHYDHCGSTGMLKRAFPHMQIVASRQAGAVLKKPNALALIKHLSKKAVGLADTLGIDPSGRPGFIPFAVDRTVSEGDHLSLSENLSIHVVETPGHTRDSLSFYIPEKGILITGEALGIPDSSGYIITECHSDYVQYAASLEKLIQLNPEIVCLGHYKTFTGKDADRYINDSLAHCREFKSLLEAFLSKEKGNMDRVMARFKKLEYDGKREDALPEVVYNMNLDARIKAVLHPKAH
jgi:glyoxylase-like metal-dependent hydrolase (beta-lactamase superfamily II)